MWQTVRERTIFRTAWYFFKIRWKSANSTEFNSAIFFEVTSGEIVLPGKRFLNFFQTVTSMQCHSFLFQADMTWVIVYICTYHWGSLPLAFGWRDIKLLFLQKRGQAPLNKKILQTKKYSKLKNLKSNPTCLNPSGRPARPTLPPSPQKPEGGAFDIKYGSPYRFPKIIGETWVT